MGFTQEEADKSIRDIDAVVDALLECRKAVEKRQPIEATVHLIDAQTRVNALAVQLAGDRADTD